MKKYIAIVDYETDILELVSIIVEPLKLPEWFLSMVIVLLCIGFVIAIILSWIYDLTGELVQASQWQPVAAREPFAIVMDLDDVVSGMYLCRLTVESRAGDTDHSVISVAVVR